MKKFLFAIIILCSTTIIFGQLMNKPEGISFDEATNRYFVSCWDSDNVVELTPEGAESEFQTNLNNSANNVLVDDILYCTYQSSVKGFNISTGEEVFHKYISGSGSLDGIAMDDDGFLYVVSHQRMLFQINVENDTVDMFVYQNPLPSYPQDMIYDSGNNRLLIIGYQSNCPIVCIYLDDLSSETISTDLDNLDGLTIDNDGNIYVASHGTNSVYKYNNDFTVGPEEVATGFNGPSGIHYNTRDEILCVSNFWTNVVDFIPMGSSVNTECKIEKSPSALFQNYPNPFNPVTRIDFDLAGNGHTTLKVYNIKGHLINTLENGYLEKGKHSYIWDGKDSQGKDSASGVYYYKLSQGNIEETGKMILAK